MKLNKYLNILNESLNKEKLNECKRNQKIEEDDELYQEESFFPMDSYSTKSKVLKVPYPN